MGRGSSSARQDMQQNELVPEMGCEMEGHEWGSGHQWVVGCRDGGGECYGPAPGWLHCHEQGALNFACCSSCDKNIAALLSSAEQLMTCRVLEVP